MEEKRNNTADKKRKRGIYAVYFGLSFFVVFVGIDQLIKANYYHMFLCMLTMVLFYLPSLIDRKLKIEFPSALEAAVLIFIFSAQILGEISEFYIRFPYWDIMLHTLNGFIMAAIGFALVDILNRSPKLHFEMSPVYVSVVAFCFSMTVGVFWEFFEYLMDIVAGTDMQKDSVIDTINSVNFHPEGRNEPVSIEGITKTVITYTQNGKEMVRTVSGGYLDVGLIDTMKDLTVNFIGAVTFSLIGFFYIKRRGKGSIFKRFVPVLKNEK